MNIARKTCSEPRSSIPTWTKVCVEFLFRMRCCVVLCCVHNSFVFYKNKNKKEPLIGIEINGEESISKCRSIVEHLGIDLGKCANMREQMRTVLLITLILTLSFLLFILYSLSLC